MGRAGARRAQERQDRRQQTTQRLAPPRAPRVSVSGPVEERRATGAAIWKPWTWRWVADIVSELRKVTWPTRRETSNLTVVVLIVSIAVAAILGGADIAFSYLVEQTLFR